ncbi:hypothetical protein VTK56DRAFT_10163 [Thermocarpiscus australiensis]
MNKLPQEIFDIIISDVRLYLLPAPLSRYATISRLWQYAVERYLFASLAVDPDDMQLLEGGLLDSRRRGYLKTLYFIVDLAHFNLPPDETMRKLFKGHPDPLAATTLTIRG